MVGVNRFALDEEEPYEPLRVDPADRGRAQSERLARLRGRARQLTPSGAALAAVRATAARAPPTCWSR